MRVIYCGNARFEMDDDEVITQYDPSGCVVGIFSASDTPSLRAWITAATTTPSGSGRQGKIPVPPKEIDASARSIA